MDANLLVKIGRRIKEIRTQRELTQEDLSYTAGVSYNYFGDIERGKRNISITILNRIAKALKVTLSELLEGIK